VAAFADLFDARRSARRSVTAVLAAVHLSCGRYAGAGLVRAFGLVVRHRRTPCSCCGNSFSRR
jgi:hypothetical protein